MKITRTGFFLGEYRHNLTDKNRLALPKRIRVEIESTEVILARGFEACIAGFDRTHWQKMATEQLNMHFNDEKGRSLRRQIFSSAMVAEVDSQGRVIVPDALLTWAGLRGKIGEELLVIGAGDHFEIWTTENWNKYFKQVVK